ncbi:hypothetical protein ILUMI_11562 [Ignelater luminosus]|uniref:Secreted protein n=1 Tax=Ignelater luminosus TaxID=2038154 RepID=A0A8K0D016_IGNLU|nr:hypothetical protein ILUMI_11562 [Ignelater luminosus]
MSRKQWCYIITVLIFMNQFGRFNLVSQRLPCAENQQKCTRYRNILDIFNFEFLLQKPHFKKRPEHKKKKKYHGK